MIKGRIWKYGDDINTDVIFAGKYTYTITDRNEMAKYAFEDLDPDFAKNVKSGDVIVAGKNFGCGSSREQAVTALKMAGVSAIIAPSFARIYYRNAINEGLPLLENREVPEDVNNGEEISINLEKGEITTQSGKTYSFPPLPEQVMGIVRDGGLIPHLKKKLAE
jgi:3-isopropylmalate/(R)-2-methylmalate dehydratase small subunit